MSRIRSQNTKLETLFLKQARKVFHSSRYRYCTNCPVLPGKPDIVFHKQKLAVFIDGDFWHGYNLVRLGKKLPNNYWKRKIENNMARDRRVNRKLRKLGWRILRFWEHNIEKEPQVVINKIIRTLRTNIKGVPEARNS